MALFSKKQDSGVPEIPSLPEFPTKSKEKDLPSLPRDFNEDVNRDIIKSALNEENDSLYSSSLADQNENLIPSPPLTENETHQHQRFLPKPQEPGLSLPLPSKQVKAGLEGPDSIFVRIDKFKTAKKEIAEIKKSLIEVEAIVNKINEIKTKEDVEIKEINLNLDKVKEKLGEVDSLIFNKV